MLDLVHVYACGALLVVAQQVDRGLLIVRQLYARGERSALRQLLLHEVIGGRLLDDHPLAGVEVRRRLGAEDGLRRPVGAIAVVLGLGTQGRLVRLLHHRCIGQLLLVELIGQALGMILGCRASGLLGLGLSFPGLTRPALPEARTAETKLGRLDRRMLYGLEDTVGAEDTHDDDRPQEQQEEPRSPQVQRELLVVVCAPGSSEDQEGIRGPELLQACQSDRAPQGEEAPEEEASQRTDQA